MNSTPFLDAALKKLAQKLDQQFKKSPIEISVTKNLQKFNKPKNQKKINLIPQTESNYQKKKLIRFRLKSQKPNYVIIKDS